MLDFHRPPRAAGLLSGTLLLLPLLLPPLLVGIAAGAPGELDLSFGGFGQQGIKLQGGISADMAVGPDGKIVTVRTEGSGIVVHRYHSNGDVDYAFASSTGRKYTNSAFPMVAGGVAVQPDGKIVIVGWTEPMAATGDYLVLRLLPNGNLDTSFGGFGHRTISCGLDDHALRVIVQPDGKLLVAGETLPSSSNTWDFAVVRLLAEDGSLDDGFGVSGRCWVQISEHDNLRDLALMPDGRIVIVGTVGSTIDRDVAIARLTPAGLLDSSFNGDGKVRVGLGGDDRATSVVVRPDGRIVVSGYSDPTDPTPRLLFLQDNGLPDPSYSGDGIISLPGGGTIFDLILQPDGRLIAVGDAEAPDHRIAVHRRLTDGNPDPSFSLDGSALYDVGDQDIGRRVTLLPDGRILILGETSGLTSGTIMVRLWPEGTPDIGGLQAFGFDEAGIPPGTGFPAGSEEAATGMAIQADGKIIVSGFVAHPISGERDFGLARFRPDGDLDTSFGTYGHVTFSFHNFDHATAVALQPDGKIVVGGYSGSGTGVNFLVARFNSDGTLDNTFGFGGFNVVDFAGGADYGYALALAPDGKIAMAGTVYNGAAFVMGVARLTADGVLDPSFDLDGKQLVQFQAGASHAATCVLVQPDLKIVVGGHVNGDFALFRLHAWGGLDDTFGCSGGIGGGGICDGKARVDMGGDDYAYALARASNGWLYLGGSRGTGPTSDFAIAQFSENGVLASCPPFPCENWPNGKAYLSLGAVDYGYALDIRSDGQILIAGTTDGHISWGQFSPTVSAAQVAGSCEMAGEYEYVAAARFVGADRIVVAGAQQFQSVRNFALAEFETAPNVTVNVPHSDPAGRLSFDVLRPNPTRGATTMSFSLERRSVVEVHVHDVSGRRVRGESLGVRSAGHHEETWDGRADDGSTASAGVYFVRLTAEGRTLGQRTLVMLR